MFSNLVAIRTLFFENGKRNVKRRVSPLLVDCGGLRKRNSKRSSLKQWRLVICESRKHSHDLQRLIPRRPPYLRVLSMKLNTSSGDRSWTRVWLASFLGRRINLDLASTKG